MKKNFIKIIVVVFSAFIATALLSCVEPPVNPDDNPVDPVVYGLSMEATYSATLSEDLLAVYDVTVHYIASSTDSTDKEIPEFETVKITSESTEKTFSYSYKGNKNKTVGFYLTAESNGKPFDAEKSEYLWAISGTVSAIHTESKNGKIAEENMSNKIVRKFDEARETYLGLFPLQFFITTQNGELSETSFDL